MSDTFGHRTSRVMTKTVLMHLRGLQRYYRVTLNDLVASAIECALGSME